MPVTNFYTVNGSIIGEKTTGGTRVDYLTDQLGSVTATVNQSAQVLNTYRYKPYGGLLAKTGPDSDPAFGWVGTQGYKPTKKSFCDFYVRARHPDSYTGRWTTVDPIGLRGGGLNYYGYVKSSPTVYIDPTGLLDPWSCGICASIIGGAAIGSLLACPCVSIIFETLRRVQFCTFHNQGTQEFCHYEQSIQEW